MLPCRLEWKHSYVSSFEIPDPQHLFPHRPESGSRRHEAPARRKRRGKHEVILGESLEPARRAAIHRDHEHIGPISYGDELLTGAIECQIGQEDVRRVACSELALIARRDGPEPQRAIAPPRREPLPVRAEDHGMERSGVPLDDARIHLVEWEEHQLIPAFRGSHQPLRRRVNVHI